MYPYNPFKGQSIQTNGIIDVARAFLAHLQWSAEQAVAADDDGIHAGINLLAAAQQVATGIIQPPCARNVTIKGNVSGITGNVIVRGLNLKGEAISETIALNGTTTVAGAKAFHSITRLDVPVRAHAPVAQVETATAAGTVTTAGNASVTITSALFAEPVVVSVPVEVDDDANAIALAIRTALAANADIAEHFVVSGADAAVVLTAKVPAANDTTLNIAIADGTGDGASVGVTTAATSANTTAGVPYDIVKVGFSDKLGLPYLQAHDTTVYTYLNNVMEGTAPTVACSTTAIEGNTIDLNSSLDGHVVDAYQLVPTIIE
jgi:hypothetical protein